MQRKQPFQTGDSKYLASYTYYIETMLFLPPIPRTSIQQIIDLHSVSTYTPTSIISNDLLINKAFLDSFQSVESMLGDSNPEPIQAITFPAVFSVH